MLTYTYSKVEPNSDGADRVGQDGRPEPNEPDEPECIDFLQLFRDLTPLTDTPLWDPNQGQHLRTVFHLPRYNATRKYRPRQQ